MNVRLLFVRAARTIVAMQSRRRFLTTAIAALFALHVGCAQAAAKNSRASAPEDRVDINHATVGELMKIPGMTQTWAARIVRFRPYRAKNDLIDRGIVSSEVYGRIKNYVVAHRGEQ
jgi:competence protein ComEA